MRSLAYTSHRSSYDIIGVKEGLDYAGVTTFDIIVKGKSGHGEHLKTIDPVVACSNNIPITDSDQPGSFRFTPATLTIGSLHAGSIRNIIPDQAVMHGTLRTPPKIV